MPSVFDLSFETETVSALDSVELFSDSDNDEDALDEITARQWQALVGNRDGDRFSHTVAPLPGDILFQRCGGGRRYIRKKV